MFRLSNLRKESTNGWTYLLCDFEVTEIKNPFGADSMWIAVEDKNEDMLSSRVYDPFVLLPVFLGMFYGQDVHIEGNISARLYHNVTHYLMSIFKKFSTRSQMVRFTVNGFDTVEECDTKLIGTGISCGVDSLTTIYDNFVMEDDPNFKINSLFLFNSGTHGHYNETSRRLFLDRAKLNHRAADELGLPMYLVDSNFHIYTHAAYGGDQPIGYLAMYSCAIGMQKYVRRYLSASNFAYDEVAEFMEVSRNFDIAEYCESYMPNLISTESFELVIDGCQYTRGEKTERISDWELAQKYLNVCVRPINHGYNCSNCNKCMWTLIPLEVMGKLDNFKDVFDIDTYKKNAKKWKITFAAHEGKDAMETSVIRYAKKRGLKIPALDEAKEILTLKEEIVRQRREINHLKYANRQIVIFGEGQTLEKNKDVFGRDVPVCAVVSHEPRAWGVCYGEFTCEKPEKILELENPVVLVSVRERGVRDAVQYQLAEMGVRDVLRLSEWIELEKFS